MMGQLVAIYHGDFATLVDAEKLRTLALAKLEKLFRLLGQSGDERNEKAIAVITEVLQTQEREAKAGLDAAQKAYSENRQAPLLATEVKKAERAYTRAQKVRNIFNKETEINNGGL